MSRHRLGDTYLFESAAGVPLEAYVSGDYVQKGDGLRAERYGDLGAIPLITKAVVKLSVMGGCPFRCRPCDAGLAGYLGNATADDIYQQFTSVVADQRLATCSKMKLHLSKLGEPSLNWEPSVEALTRIVNEHPQFTIIPTVTTLPRTRDAFQRLATDMTSFHTLTQTKITAGATSEEARRRLFGAVTPIEELLSDLTIPWSQRSMDHRITLTFLALPDQPFDADWILHRVPLTLRPYVTVEVYKVNKTENARRNRLIGFMDRYSDAGPFEGAMQRLRDHGMHTYFSAPSDGEQRALVANGSSMLLTLGSPALKASVPVP